MKQLLLAAVIFLLVSVSGQAQRLVLNSKASLSFSAHILYPIGNAEVRKGSFSFPALMANFRPGFSLGVGYNRQFKPWLNVEARYATMIFSEWQFSGETDPFNDASVKIHSLSLGVTAKTVFSEQGFKNKVKFYAGIAPGAYLIQVEAPELPVPSTRTIRPGVQIDGGIEYAIRNNLAVSINGGYRVVAVESDLYQEKKFQWLQAGIGIVFRLQKDRNYLRASL